MRNLNILICEGNTPEEGKIFQDVGIPSHTKSLKESLSFYNKDLKIDVLNPCLELNLNKIIPNDTKLSATILKEIVMPAQDKFTPDDRLEYNMVH